MRRLLPILIPGCLATSSLLASGTWDFHGGAGMNAGRVDNPGFVDSDNPKYDPNSPKCDPNDAAYDPDANVCQKRTSDSSRRSTTTGFLRMMGGVSAQWPSTRFDITYSPFASYYYDQSELSQVSHNLNSTWQHAYSARTTLNIDAIASYTPEQEVDPNGQSTNRVYVNQTNQMAAGYRAGYAYAVSAKTTISGTYRYATRTFGDDDYVDNSTHNAGVTWRRRIGSRSFIQTGYEYGQFLYGDGPSTNDPNDPNAIRSRDLDSSHHQASVGYGVDLGRHFKVSANAGYNILQPLDSRFDSTSGLYLNGQADWTGTKLAVSTGYVHSLSDGAGAFANSEADSMRANLRYAFTPTISADLSAARNVNERITAGTSVDEASVRTIYGRASLNWAFADSWSANATYAHFTQSESGTAGQAPDIRSNRWTAGVSWSFK